MRKAYTVITISLLLVILSGGVVYSFQDEAAKEAMKTITKENIEAQLGFLASDYTEGRETATRGLKLAAEYIASLYQIWGIQPAGDKYWGRENGKRVEKRSYFQNIDLIEFSPIDEETYITVSSTNEFQKLKRTKKYNFKTDFNLSNEYFGFSENEVVTTPIVFAGYGIFDESSNFDEYSGIDVRDKIVVIFDGVPEAEDLKGLRQRYGGLMGIIAKLMTAQDKGAAALLIMNPPLGDLPSPALEWAANNNPHHPQRARVYEGDEPFPPFRAMKITDKSMFDFLPSFKISNRMVEDLFSEAGFCIKEAQKRINKTGKPASRVLENIMITLKTAVKTKIMKTQNVLGYIEGSDPYLKEELIVIGGHYDHMGKYNGMIFNGADDDASGTVGAMEIAHAFSQAKIRPRRSVLFASWTGEEKGLLGSYYFTNHPFKPLDKIVLNINMDMIGRVPKDQKGEKIRANCALPQQVEELKEFVKGHNELIGLNLRVMARNMVFEGSDHLPFVQKKIPVIYYSAGNNTDYHQPSDSIEKINFDAMEKIVRLAFLNAWEAAHRWSKFEWLDQ